MNLMGDVVNVEAKYTLRFVILISYLTFISMLSQASENFTYFITYHKVAIWWGGGGISQQSEQATVKEMVSGHFRFQIVTATQWVFNTL